MGSAISNAAACGACGQLQSSCYSSVLTSVILMGGCAILRAGQPCGDMILILPPMLMIMRPTVEDLADSGTKTKDFVGCVEMPMTCPSCHVLMEITCTTQQNQSLEADTRSATSSPQTSHVTCVSSSGDMWLVTAGASVISI